MTSDTAAARKVRSIERVITVLNEFSPERPTITLSHVAALLLIHKSSASRLLRQLADEGFLRRLDEGTTYGIGLRLFEIGSLYSRSNDLLQAAAGALERLVEHTGLTAQLCVRDGSASVVVASRESTRLIRAAANLGGRLPLDITASGRVLLAGRSDSEIRTLLEAGGHGRQRPVGEVIDLIRDAERRNAAVVVGGYHPEVLALAVPVFSGAGDVAAALCLVAPATGSALDRVDELVETLQGEALAVSRRLGH